MQRKESHTKRGPGRRHVTGDGTRTAKQLSAGAMARALANHFTSKRKVKMTDLRDEHGAYTQTGRDRLVELFGNGPPRRKWLAGISAQRGY